MTFIASALKRRPSLPTAIALLALAVATTGTAVAATGQLVNIADGTTASHVAKVDASGHLLTAVSGSVTATAATPANLFTATGAVSTSCAVLYTPPSGKAAVVLDLQGSVWQKTGTGSTTLRFWVSPTSSPCSGGALKGFMASSNTTGTITQDMGSGFGIPAGYALYTDVFTSGSSPDQWVTAAQGYITPAASVPASSAASATAPGVKGPASSN